MAQHHEHPTTELTKSFIWRRLMGWPGSSLSFPGQAHGVIMVVALAILVPLSVGIAHSMRGSWGPRLWFQLHRGMGVRANLILLV